MDRPQSAIARVQGGVLSTDAAGTSFLTDGMCAICEDQDTLEVTLASSDFHMDKRVTGIHAPKRPLAGRQLNGLGAQSRSVLVCTLCRKRSSVLGSSKKMSSRNALTYPFRPH